MDVETWRYRRAREAFFARHGASFPGTLADPFDILAPYPLPRAEVLALTRAAAGLASVYTRVAVLLRSLPDEALLEIGLPPETLTVARSSVPRLADIVVGRFDLARTPGGYKLLELNADAPGLLVETFSLNRIVCEDAGQPDPNAGAEQALTEALLHATGVALDYLGKERQLGHVVATAAGNFDRDSVAAIYLSRLLQTGDLIGAEYVPDRQLSIDESGVYDAKEQRVDVLLRLLPLHVLGNRLTRSRRPRPAGSETESGLFDLLQRRRVALINPPSAFLLESKAVQVVIWNLFEQGLYFNDDERVLIEKYMLPSYLDAPLVGAPYVSKPIRGAQGDTVSLVGPDGRLVKRSTGTSHSEQAMMYQQYVELPEVELLTELGPRMLRTVISCFIIADKPIGVCMRAGEAITDESAWVVPLYVTD